jgi:hypothetical protein
MKNNVQSKTPVNTRSKQARPENKDELDSRKNEEQFFKGNDVTHNSKETKKGKKANS